MRFTAHDPINRANSNLDAQPEHNLYNKMVIERFRYYLDKRSKNGPSNETDFSDEDIIIKKQMEAIHSIKPTIGFARPIVLEKLSEFVDRNPELIAKECEKSVGCFKKMFNSK